MSSAALRSMTAPTATGRSSATSTKPRFPVTSSASRTPGSYYLAGNAYVGTDNLNQVYTGLTLSTTQALSSLYVGFDDNGGGSNDADTLTITAFGAGGNLASQTATLNGPGLSFLDTSAKFGGLSGVTGYLFATNSLSLYAFEGQGYVLADDLTFKAPVPEASTPVSLGLLLALGGLTAIARRRKADRV